MAIKDIYTQLNNMPASIETLRAYLDLRKDSLLASNNEYFYLCGVVYPWSWKDNFHCAFRKKEGAEFTYKFRNTEVYVINAEQIEIADTWINYGLSVARNRLYNTCRNWQFANWFEKNVKHKVPEKPKYEQLQLDLF